MTRQWEYMTLLVVPSGKVMKNEEKPTPWDDKHFKKEVLPALGLLGWEMCTSEALSITVEMADGMEVGDILPGSHEFYFKKEIEQLPGEELTMLATR
jgi:hypothetical protein